MIDWSTELVGTYELTVTNTRKGRGAWIFETDLGLLLLKEYKGTVKRLEFEEAVLGTMEDNGTLRVDQYIRNKEGGLLSTAEDGTRYVVKRWFSDRECDLKDRREILSSVRQIIYDYIVHYILIRFDSENTLRQIHNFNFFALHI